MIGWNENVLNDVIFWVNFFLYGSGDVRIWMEICVFVVLLVYGGM